MKYRPGTSDVRNDQILKKNSRDRNGYGGQSARLQRNQGGHGQHRNSERGHHGGQGAMGRGRSQNSLAKSSSGSSMGARHQRPNSIGRDEFDDGGENQFVTNYEAEMSALKPRETFTLSPIKKDPEMSYVEPVVNQGKIFTQSWIGNPGSTRAILPQSGIPRHFCELLFVF